MLTTTLKIVRSGLESDPTLTAADRNRFIAVLRDGLPSKCKPTTEATTAPPRLLRRAEVGRRLSCSLRTVDKLPLKKFKLPGRKRAAGFLESDVNDLLAGKAAHE